MKNIIPSFTSGKWSLWYAFENKKPVEISSDNALTLMAKAYTDAGKWICTFDVTPGMDYIFSFDVKLERIEHHRACVRAIAVWQDEKGTMLRCDYAVNEEKLDENIALMNRAQPILAEHGIALGYHNNSGEFFPMPYGKVVEDEIIARTNAALQIDTWWAFNAGVDPVAYCEAHKDRIRVIHLKDGIACKPECRNQLHWGDGVEGRSVGSGEAPILAVREWCLKNGVLMVVESEGLDPTGPDEVKRCIDYLRTLD